MYTRYQHLLVYSTDAPPTPEEIAAIEQKLGTTLPDDFVAFLNAANGGSLEYSVIVPLQPRAEVMLFGQIYSTKPNCKGQFSFGTFLGELDTERSHKDLPQQVLPFARDGGASVLYLDLTSEGAGRVVAYIHGLPAWTGLRQKSNFVEIASSFQDYLNALSIDSDYANEIIEDAMHDNDGERLEDIRHLLDLGMPDWRDRLDSRYVQALDHE